MKRLLSLILCMMTLLSVLPFAASADGFIDVAEGKWYTEGISYCAANGFMAGVSNDTFDRNGTLTRAMFVTILAQVDWADTEPYANEQVFTDVKPGRWYSGAVNWAYANGLAGGLGDGTFGYKNPVTREQMAVFLYAYVCYAIESGLHIDLDYINESYDKPYSITERADLSGYTDADRIHSWASDAMAWAVAAGIIGGTSDTTLDPRGNCTRAQAAVLIYALQRDVFNGRCDHNMIEATCYTPTYCTNCDLTGGFKDHSYDADGKCTVCGAEYDAEANCGHVWVEAGCDYDSFCWKCFVELEGTATGHDLVPYEEDPTLLYCKNVQDGYECGYVICAGDHTVSPASCIEPEYCTKCLEYLSDPIDHSFGTDNVCTFCGGEYDAEYNCVHYWIEPGCVTYGYCKYCGVRNADANGHDYDEAGYCRVCGYSGTNDHEHRWNAPLCWDDNYCLICGAVPERVDHEYGEEGRCIYCGSRPPCETHVWVPASCKKNGYCAVCYTVNPDEPDSLGHDFNEETHICSRCNLFRDWTLSDFEHFKKNIQLNGISLADGSLAISDDFDDGTVHIFMRPTGNDAFFVQFIANSRYYGKHEYLGTVELTYDSTPAVEFTMEISREGEFLFSASGDFDSSRDPDFNGIDYTGCINISQCWNEAELSEDELAELISRYISLTMVNANTVASQRFDANLEYIWE